MAKTLTLYLPLKTFEKLHAAADGKGQFCKVRKEDLLALLMDHSRALRSLNEAGVRYEDAAVVKGTASED